MKPLDGFHVLGLAINLPGPLALARLADWGAAVTKIEPPEGDPLALWCREWYATICGGFEVLTLNLKQAGDFEKLDALLGSADLLLTANRPASLGRLGLDWPGLHARFPRLCYVGIVGFPHPRENVPGHDLTYQVGLDLVAPPSLPRALVADIAGAQQAAAEGMALLMARERGQGAGHTSVALSDAGTAFAESLRRGLTAPGGLLGGGLANYNIYPAQSGYVAVAALERHFRARLLSELGLSAGTAEELAAAFLTRSAAEWEDWAQAHDLPLAAIEMDTAIP